MEGVVGEVFESVCCASRVWFLAHASGGTQFQDNPLPLASLGTCIHALILTHKYK